MKKEDLTTDLAMQKANLGQQAEAFTNSNFGRYMFERAELEEDILVKELRAADADDLAENRRIRNKLAVVDLLREWLNEVIQAGIIGEQDLINIEAMDQQNESDGFTPLEDETEQSE